MGINDAMVKLCDEMRSIGGGDDFKALELQDIGQAADDVGLVLH